MKARCLSALLLVLSLCSNAWPDTVTTNENLSINGSVLEMTNGVLRMKAQFSDGETLMTFRTNELKSVEFNLLVSNPGAPPKIMGIGPPADRTMQQQGTTGLDTIVFRGGERQPCPLARIDADSVSCGSKNAKYNRRVVLRIVFGSR